MFSVAILMISNEARPATNVVVVARAGTIRPAIYCEEEMFIGGKVAQK